MIHKLIGFDPKYRSIGVIGGRTGAGPHLMAADEAIKATNTEVIMVEMPRDTKGGAGHGNLIVFGAEDVSDARRAVEVTLEALPKYFGDVYANDSGLHRKPIHRACQQGIEVCVGRSRRPGLWFDSGRAGRHRHAHDRYRGQGCRCRGAGLCFSQEEHQS